MEELGLADAINQLRSELDTARKAGLGSELQFAVGPVEVELSLELRSSTAAQGGLKWVVVSAGAEASKQSTVGHRIKLTLKPSVHQEDLVVSKQGERRD